MDENNVTEGVSGIPEQPEAPENAVASEQPETPEAAVESEQSEAPENAVASEQPEIPEAAVEPEQSETPEDAGVPEQPEQPEAPIYNMYGDQVPAEQPKKKKTGLIIGIIAAAVAVVAVVLILVLVVFKKTPEERLKEAFNNTFSELEGSEHNVFEESLGISEIDSDDLDINATYTFNTVSGLEGIEGAAFDFSTSVENKDDIMNEDISLNLQIAGESLGINLYYLDDILYFDMPELFGDAVFQLNTEDVLNAYDTVSDDTTSDENERARELYEENVGDLDEQVKESITYEKVGRTTITNHNGKNIKCTEYTVTVPAEQVEAYVMAFCDYLNDYADEYLTDDILNAMNLTVNDFKSYVTSIKEYYGYIFTKDFSYNAYVSDNKVIRLEADYSISLLGVKLEFLMDFMGEDMVMDDVYAKVSVADAAIEYTYSQTGTSDMAKTSTDVLVTSSGTTLTEIASNMEFTAETGEYSYITNVIYDNQTAASLDITGDITNINKGKSFDIGLSSISLTVDDNVVFDMSADISYGNLDEAIKEPDLENVYDIYNLNDEDLDALFNEENFNRIIDAWSAALNFGDLLDDLSVGDEYSDFSDYTDEDGYSDEDFSSEEYDDVVIANNNYTITINDPQGFIRAYADDYYISIYDDIYDVSYALYEDLTDMEAVCQDLADSYSSVYEVTNEELVDVTYSEGTVKAYIMTLEISSSTITEIVYFYPLQDNDYLQVTVDVWDYTGETPSAPDIADMFLIPSVVDIAYN